MTFQPAYLSLLESGKLAHRAGEAHASMARCEMCAVRCRANRLSGKVGGCRTGERALLVSYGAHHGEEAVLRGWNGSGTIFFGGCSLRCQFCQNADISQARTGREVEADELAAIMLELQSSGCHNINLVTPSHVVPQILAALQIAAQAGLRLPLVYNTGGYDALDTLKLLDGVIDIYMPDMKYSNAQTARRYSKVIDYPRINQQAVREMHRQVGDLQINAEGLAVRGLLVRHLVMPNGLAGTKDIARFLAGQVSADTYLNIMDQYYPAFDARLYASINRPITPAEYQDALAQAREAGLRRFNN